MRKTFAIAAPLEISYAKEAEAADNSTFLDINSASEKWNCYI